jgi:hypothetical protein
MPKEFVGCAYFRGPNHEKRAPESWTTKEIPWGAITPADVIGKPVLFSHDRNKVGEVVDAWADKYNGMHVRLRVDSDFHANLIGVSNATDSTTARGISMSHGVATYPDGSKKYLVNEVSVCHRNARLGTVINNTMSLDKYKEWTSSDAYTTQDYLEDKLNVLHYQNAIKEAVVTMEPQFPSGNPTVIDMTRQQQQQPQQQQQSNNSTASPSPPGPSQAVPQGDLVPPPPDAPVTYEEVMAAMSRIQANPEEKISIMKALNATTAEAQRAMAAAKEREEEVQRLKAALQQQEQETLVIQAAHAQKRAEEAAFEKNIVEAVRGTVRNYMEEADPVVCPPNMKEYTLKAMESLLTDNPGVSPAIGTLINAARHPAHKRKQQMEDEFELESQKLRASNLFAFATPQSQLSRPPLAPQIQVNASRSGRAGAASSSYVPAQGLAQGPSSGQQQPQQDYVPPYFQNGDLFQKYMTSAENIRSTRS